MFKSHDASSSFKNTKGSRDVFIAFWFIFTFQTFCITVSRETFTQFISSLPLLLCRTQTSLLLYKFKRQTGSSVLDLATSEALSYPQSSFKCLQVYQHVQHLNISLGMHHALDIPPIKLQDEMKSAEKRWLEMESCSSLPNTLHRESFSCPTSSCSASMLSEIQKTTEEVLTSSSFTIITFANPFESPFCKPWQKLLHHTTFLSFFWQL